jgi:hypothetical protein
MALLQKRTREPWLVLEDRSTNTPARTCKPWRPMGLLWDSQATTEPSNIFDSLV